jgi:hypothetical protein
MLHAFRACAGAFILVIAVIAPAAGQFPPGPDDQTGQPGAAPQGKKSPPPAAGSTINGSWSGELTQVGSQTPYRFELVISPGKAETRYPDLDCTGKLTRVGGLKSYTFFVEVITKGQADKGGRCPDGTITVARQGDELALGWFGSVQGNTIVAYGTLRKK